MEWVPRDHTLMMRSMARQHMASTTSAATRYVYGTCGGTGGTREERGEGSVITTGGLNVVRAVAPLRHA